MNTILKIFSILVVFSLLNTNIYAADVLDKGTKTIGKIKNESGKVFNSLIKKSLNEDEIKEFLSNYVITIDDKRGDGLVTYYFDDKVYKRYKDLELVSEGKWKVSYLDKKLKIFYGNEKSTWKIQPGKINTINIKNKITSLGKLYEFSYQSKTDYHVRLEEKKIK
mgnify:FL=1